jgi:hypothetical protein
VKNVRALANPYLRAQGSTDMTAAGYDGLFVQRQGSP